MNYHVSRYFSCASCSFFNYFEPCAPVVLVRLTNCSYRTVVKVWKYVRGPSCALRKKHLPYVSDSRRTSKNLMPRLLAMHLPRRSSLLKRHCRTSAFPFELFYAVIDSRTDRIRAHSLRHTSLLRTSKNSMPRLLATHLPQRSSLLKRHCRTSVFPFELFSAVTDSRTYRIRAHLSLSLHLFDRINL